MKNVLKYKNYIGSVQFDPNDMVFHGRVLGIKDVLTFEGETVKDLVADFHALIDEYIEDCKEIGKKPEKPFSGKLNIRLGPELHAKAVIASEVAGLSLNAFISKATKSALNTIGHR